MGMPIASILVESGRLSATQVANAIAAHRGLSETDALREAGVISEKEMLEALSDRYGVGIFDGNLMETPLPEEFAQVPRSFLLEAAMYPVACEGGTVTLAVANPGNYEAADQLGVLVGARPVMVLASETAIREAINVAYLAASQDDDSGSKDDGLADGPLVQMDLLDAGDEAPVVRTINRILSSALQAKASDIHIEPGERDVAVRYRVDGILEDGPRFPKALLPSLASRIKIMSNLDITERRRDQDGRIKVVLADKPVDIRVSILPTAYGERVVLRLLEREQVLLGLEEVGMPTGLLHTFSGFLDRSNGLALVTGPTGSGKTTTLYGALRSLDTETRNVITLEDPVEYQIPGISQIQINPKVDLTFARGLRSVLRQDPDVIMVGEIRDKETAEMALQASLTGHLVLSTLHTNDSPSAVARLCEMGIEPFLLSTSLLGVCAQRLVRRLCPVCRQPASRVTAELPKHIPAPARSWEPKGCEACRGTGYQGREGIFEILQVSEDIHQGIMAQENASLLAARARRSGFRSMLETGMEKVEAGKTTVAEVLRVASMGG